MGVRLYNPQTGRFLSVDPVAGANANSYIYPTDPNDDSDLSGKGDPTQFTVAMGQRCDDVDSECVTAWAECETAFNRCAILFLWVIDAQGDLRTQSIVRYWDYDIYVNGHTAFHSRYRHQEPELGTYNWHVDIGYPSRNPDGTIKHGRGYWQYGGREGHIGTGDRIGFQAVGVGTYLGYYANFVVAGEWVIE